MDATQLSSASSASHPHAPVRYARSEHAILHVGIISKSAIILATGIFLWIDPSDTLRLAIVAGLFAYLIALGKYRFALWFLVFLGILGGAYYVHFYRSINIVFLSPIMIRHFWGSFPMMLAVVALLTSPPGQLSSAASRLHLPRPVVLGVLVTVRFFPTFSSASRKLKDSMRKRGLLSWKQVFTNLGGTFEYTVVPLLMALINSADQLAASAVTRGAEAPTIRSSYYYKPFGLSDALTIAGALAIAGSALLWKYDYLPGGVA